MTCLCVHVVKYVQYLLQTVFYLKKKISVLLYKCIMNLKSIQNETKIRSGLDNSGCDTIFAVTVLLLRVKINQQKRLGIYQLVYSISRDGLA